MKIKIPASIEDAVAELAGVERLLMAKEWERAAIVAAFVDMPGQGKASSSLSTREFAGLGIAGLKSKDTVQRYVEAWARTGKPRPRPGEVVDLDALPEWRVAESSQDNVTSKPGTIAAALADPEVRQKVLDRMPEDTRRSLSQEVVRTVMEDNAARGGGRVPTDHDMNPDQPNAFDAVIPDAEERYRVLNLIRRTIDAVRTLGPLAPGDPLVGPYFELQMILATSVDEAVVR